MSVSLPQPSEVAPDVQGTTAMLLTRVPHFRDIMVASFECEQCNFRYCLAILTGDLVSCITFLYVGMYMTVHCAYFLVWCVRNNEVSFTGTFGEQGVKYTLTVVRGDQQALSRQVVKSDNAVVTIPELEFEIPAATQKGSITTVEGLLMDAAANIKLLQEERRAADPTTAKLIDEFLAKLDMCQQGEKDFTLLVDDPAGNSFVESPGGNPRQDAILQASNSRYAGSAVALLHFTQLSHQLALIDTQHLNLSGYHL